MPQFIDRQEQAPQIQETPWTKLLAENRDRGTVLYYFSADNCKFCTMASPWIDEIEAKYKDEGLVVLGVDTTRSASIAGSAGVTGVPVLIMTQGGEPINRVVGWSNDMDKEIEANLGLLDLFGKRPGLRGAEQQGQQATTQENTCEGCGKEDSPALAELAQNISAELQKIREDIAGLRNALALKADK